MQGTARIGDTIVGIHTCCGDGHPHGTVGMILTGSGDVITNGAGTARVGDTGIHYDGLVLLLTGSDSVFVNGLNKSRIGDFLTVVPGPGTIVTGSGDVLAG